MVGVKVKPAPRRPAPPKGSSPAEPHTPSTLRLFYALKVPATLAPPLQEAQGKLRGNWRPVPAEQFHVTLAYLPAVPPARVDDLKRLGAQLTQDLPPLHLKLRGTGYFPNEGSPRVWFVKVEGEGLNELAAALRAGLQALGVDTDDLPFKAHVTLARKKGPAPRVPPLLFSQGWQAPQVTLYRSILRKTGPIHETVSTFRLRGAPAPASESAPTSPEPRAQETL
ncbi:RNA 2',3'-cyclic phosphodiesterase [Deinococcus multiflagellatus]|uniref:RNA 2',3'-cyclic phosphodiesterase n=1 Tax=Deinococcus multiflagellatus TaxID=1656887 RepID=UPI001CCCCABC|nr:RNA 2',3'-cyclic phosphodiesterase [Deinococcus multiflagellatus]MBZ9712294.1 RNA 2',3'-cyclic phosphodiesterase [Deinococcus multiflagellatus]